MRSEQLSGWETAVRRFVTRWAESRPVSGVLICGSFITGEPGPRSDIDLHIVLPEGTGWRERGNRVIDGYLIEYFANPPAQIRKYFHDDLRSRRTMSLVQFATGSIHADSGGTVEALAALAKSLLPAAFEIPRSAALELLKYSVWDTVDNALDACERGAPDARFVYYTALEALFDDYSRFLGRPRLSPHRIMASLSGSSLRRRYLLDDFPDRAFADEYIAAITDRDDSAMPRHLEAIAGIIFTAAGGFEIDGFSVTTPADVNR